MIKIASSAVTLADKNDELIVLGMFESEGTPKEEESSKRDFDLFNPRKSQKILSLDKSSQNLNKKSVTVNQNAQKTLLGSYDLKFK